MTGKVPHAAFCEEYDEDAHIIIPETRQVANLAAKRSQPNLRSAGEALVDIASDSGYSSRTAATVNSTQSGPSGRKAPVPLKVDTAPKRTDLERVRSHRKDRPKERPTRPSWDEKMQVGTYPAASHHPAAASMQRSPSRSRRRENSQMRHFPGTCWECDHGLYHGSTPVEPRAIEYPYYGAQSTTSSVHDYPPPSPQGPRYAPSAVQDVHVSHSSRPRSGRSYSYHTNNQRPVSFHGMIPGMGGAVLYPPNHIGRYEHGPPPSSSAYANTQPYPPAPYGQPSPYFARPEYSQPDRRERSVSRTRDQGRARRGSTYGPPVVDYDPPSAYEDDESLDLGPPRAPRPRLPSHSSHDRDEDYYRMPPPPVKHKPAPNIIQKRPELHRKAVTAPSVTSDRHPSRSMDLSDMRDALPEYGYRRSSREAVIPARTRSIRDTRRSTSYHDSSRPSRVAVENSRRRRPTVYDYLDAEEDDEEDEDDDGDEIEEKQRSAEEYQASRSAKPVPTPLTEDALYKSKASRAESDSGSQKSRSNSSRGSDARTQNGSGAGAKPEEDNNIVMTMNGVTMSFTQESVGGKKISVRAGETGALELNIEGKRPKKYLTNGSDYTGSVARRELEDPRRARTDRRSDRASRRSSRSTYSGRY
ncbi:hypothetical protein ETB97_007367 [Aspergillus alliaceus]|uniref:Uncharacterized protein n=1 Tax=Petromyces alliaceus TaxID=209559 RepID=A0A5N7C8E6_PETAA|nr:hypothetical protein BDV23DRAFT_88952 [Aspergillus alliaceus]KAF5864535.1 hypothetical protein ETB97_007367 [Aspergillus burnettii]